MSDENTDTVPFDVLTDTFPYVVNREDDPPDTAPAPHVPEPALVRGFIVAGLGLVSAIVGRQVGADWVDPFLALYVVAAPVGLAWWIRRNVSPAKT